jgi:hypothetical protein
MDALKELTREEIENTPAGREMDVLIEQEIFGRKIANVNSPSWQDGYSYEETFYSSDISCAWALVEKLNQLDVWICVSNNFTNPTKDTWLKGGFICEFSIGWDGEIDFVMADTVPLAICRAARLVAEILKKEARNL